MRSKDPNSPSGGKMCIRDRWNVWGKAFVGYLTVAITGKLYFGIIVACIMIVMELILGDAMQPRVQRVTGIENVSCPHRHMLLCSLIYPVDKLLRKVPFLNKDYNLNSLRKKFGVLFDRHILGFILGTAFGLIARYGVIESIKLGIVAGAALYLLPIVVLLTLGFCQGDEVTISAEGEDAKEAVDSLVALIETGFGEV